MLNTYLELDNLLFDFDYGKNGEKPKFTAVTVSVFALLGFILIMSYANPVYAVPVSEDCLDSNGAVFQCSIDVDSNTQLVDHGVNITVMDQAAYAQNTAITVEFSGNSVSSSPQRVQLYPNPNTQNAFTGYVYFKNSDNLDQVLLPIVTLLDYTTSNPSPFSIQASYTPLSMPTPTPITQQLSIGTAYYDNTNMTWDPNFGYKPYPIANQLPHPKFTNKCAGGNFDSFGICSNWKIYNPATQKGALKIPFPTTPGNYNYACDTNPQDAPYPGTLVGNSTLDPQCAYGNSRDIYVEVDAIDKQMPDVKVLQKVIDAFAVQRIALHIQLDETIPVHRHEIGSDVSGSSGTSQVDSIKKWFGGTLGERTCTNNILPTGASCIVSGSTQFQPLLTAKKQVFHYALFISAQTGNTRSGMSEQPGNDMVISLGTFTGGMGSIDEISGTFMHELGHNLNLQHGGADPNNCKPIYDSVMNYEYQDTSIAPDRTLDYSNGAFSQLNEGGLVETDGIPLSSPSVSHYPTLAYGYITTPAGDSSVQTVPAGNSTVLWVHPDMHGIPSSTPTASRISDMHSKRITSDCTGAITQPLIDYNDWNTIAPNFKIGYGSSSFWDTYKVKVSSPTNSSYYIMEQNGLNSDTPSPWMIDSIKHYNDAAHLNFINDFLKQTHLHGKKSTNFHGLKTYEMPLEISLTDIIAHHKLTINSILSHVSYLNSSLFESGAAQADLVSTLQNAEDSVDDYGKTTSLLYDANNKALSIKNDHERNHVLQELHNSILTHRQVNTVNFNHYHNVVGLPVADAGHLVSVKFGKPVHLNGVNSMGGNLAYQWTQVSGDPVTLSAGNGGSPSFIAPSSNQTMTFELHVQNSFGTDSATVQVKVHP